MSRIVALVCLASLSAAAQTECPSGQARTADTAGNCCWPEQVWASSRSACVGTPRCPEGARVEGEACVSGCAPGQAITADTDGHCCWAGQVWSKSRQLCIGVPQCPSGFAAAGESCTAQTLGEAAPPPTPVGVEPPPAVSATEPPQAVTRARMPLVVAGVAVFGAGWVVALMTAAGGAAYSNGGRRGACWSSMASVTWIPLVGPGLGAAAVNGGSCGQFGTSSALGVAAAAIDTILQWGGVAMFTLGLVLRREVPLEPGEVAHAFRPSGWALVPAAPGAPLGLSFSLAHH